MDKDLALGWLKTIFLLSILSAAIQFFHSRLSGSIKYSSDYDYHNKRLIMKPRLAKAMSLGFDRVVADFYWLTFAQYYGDVKACRDEQYRYAADYLRLIVALDPHFMRPYWYAAFVLAGDRRDACKGAHDDAGARTALETAREILDYGIRENPDDWTLPYIAGFSQYIFAKNDAAAAGYYRRASKCPGAPDWLGRLATYMGSGFASKIRVDAVTWRRAFLLTKDAAFKEHARKELQRIWSQVYWMATKPVRLEKTQALALVRLKEYDVELLPEDRVPKSQETGSNEWKGIE